MSYHRAIRATGAGLTHSALGTPHFLLSELHGTEQLNQLFEYTVLLTTQDEYGQGILDHYIGLSSAQSGGAPGSNLDLASLIGTPVHITIDLDGKVLGADLDQITIANALNGVIGRTTRHIDGIVTEAQYAGVSGRYAQYRLILKPWLYLLTQTHNSRIYQQQSIPDVIKAVLEAYPYAVEWRLAQEYPIRDYIVQYDESDYDFVARLLAEAGINYHFEHQEDRHTLILADHLGAYQPLPSAAYHTLSVYPPELKLQEEYIHSFNPYQRVTTGQVMLADYQFKSPQSDTRVSQKAEHNALEIYDWQQGNYSDTEQGQNKAQIRFDTLQQHQQRVHAAGNLRGIQAGHTFTLTNHPTEAANRDWLILGHTLHITENPAESRAEQRFHVHTDFIVQPDTQAIRPEPIAKPQARLQTATVVGPAEQELWTDTYGRIKVKFHWHRNDPANEQSTCWMRTATPWMGHQYGAIQVPRIGQEVLVDFIGNDPDMPLIIGRVTNPEQMSPWSLPDQQLLSGFRSKELFGSRNNHLILDDSTGQIQAQLQSDHQTSRLSLGYITRIIGTAGRADYRGQGAELRTDGWGVVRADKGLYLTTYGGNAHLTELSAAQAQLHTAQQQQRNHNQLAIDHQADERSLEQTAQAQLHQQNQQVAGSAKRTDGQFPELEQAHLVFGSPAGIALTTAKTAHLVGNRHIALTSGKDTDLSVGKRLIASVGKGISLFTQSKGLTAFAAKGKVQIQAQSDAVEVIADQVLKLISAKSKVEIAAHDEILLTAKGSYTKINGKGIEHGTPKAFTWYTPTLGMPGPRSMPVVEYPGMPKHFNNKVDAYDIFWDFDLSQVKYQAALTSGEILEGMLDEHGRTARITSNKAERVEVLFDAGTEWAEEFIPNNPDNRINK